MEGELIGEAVCALIEAAAGSDDKKGCGCLIALVIVAVLGFIIYFTYSADTLVPHKTCGKIIYKLENDSILLDVNGKKKIYHVSHDLFINKKENDSLCITK
jgi:hypothetical protein